MTALSRRRVCSSRLASSRRRSTTGFVVTLRFSSLGLGALIEGDLEGQPAPGDAEPAEDGLLQDHQGQQQPELFHQGDQQGAGGIYEAEQGEHGQAQGDGQEAKKPEVS
jgi:hypothetical protein